MNAAMATPAGTEAGCFLVSDESTFIDFEIHVFLTRDTKLGFHPTCLANRPFFAAPARMSRVERRVQARPAIRQ